MSLKVCLCISGFNPGGSERQIVNLARELDSRGINVTLLYLQNLSQQSYYVDSLNKTNVKIVSAFSQDFFKEGLRLSRRNPAFYQGIPGPRPLKMQILFLAGAFHRLNPDVVHTYLDILNCTAGCAAVLADVPLHIASFRSLDPARAPNGIPELTYPLYRYLLMHGHPQFEANSHAGAKHFAHWLDIAPENIAYCPNGLNPEACVAVSAETAQKIRLELDIAPGAPVLLNLARFCSSKAPETMLEVFARALAVCPDCHYLIAGSGMAHEAEMGTMVKERGLAGHVHLLGVQRDVASLLAAADIFFLPSRIEGFPNALMEAMAAGLPIVASNVGGIPDLVRDGHDGFLHEATDVEGMAKSVQKLLDDAELRAQMGKNGRQRVMEEFSLQKLGDRVLAQYQHCLLHRCK